MFKIHMYNIVAERRVQKPIIWFFEVQTVLPIRLTRETAKTVN